MVISCTRWLSIRLDLMSSLFITIVALTAILVVENPGEYTQAFVETMWEKVLLQFFFSPPHLGDVY